jgi:hypothetical protein
MLYLSIVAMLLHTCKCVVISSLAAVFFTFFGHPSYIKYLKQDTVFTETNVKYDPQKPVGIIIFVWQTYEFYGWKDNKNKKFDLKKYCNASTDLGRVVQCINIGTFKHDDIIEKQAGLSRATLEFSSDFPLRTRKIRSLVAEIFNF